MCAWRARGDNAAKVEVCYLNGLTLLFSWDRDGANRQRTLEELNALLVSEAGMR